MSDTFYVTTPIYYVNADLHIGGAYTTIAADVLARYNRLKGKDVFFLTGSDEHGQKIQEVASEAGTAPQQLADSVVERFLMLWKNLNITNDDFIRTTEPRHITAVQALFQKLFDKGLIYKGVYKGLYCISCEQYLAQRKLIDGCCPVCGRTATTMEQENYFFKLSQFQKWIRDHIESHPNFIEPQSRRNEILSRLYETVEDVSVSRRDFAWGVPMPFDSEHVIWVWFDALTNYISALGYPEDTELIRNFWGEAVHIVGKDIIWFHTVIWPCMLRGVDLPPPRKIFAHGWWTINGKKISKSIGNVIYPEELIELHSRDALRYFLLREIPFGADGDMSYQSFANRINNDLADNLGNLLNRTLTMVEKFFDSRVPTPASATSPLRDAVDALWDKVDAALDRLQFHTALAEIWSVASIANKYIEDSKPWLLHKEGKQKKLSDVLYALLETLRILSWFVTPVMPDCGDAMRTRLGIPEESGKLPELLSWGSLQPGTQVEKGEILFKRVNELVS